MHSGPGCGFIALALTRAFDRYVGRGGGGGTKKLGFSLQTYGTYRSLVPTYERTSPIVGPQFLTYIGVIYPSFARSEEL